MSQDVSVEQVEYCFESTPMVNTKEGVSLNAMPDPQVLGETMESLEDDEQSYEDRQLWEACRDPSHPCHHLFEWDDAIGGAKYRTGQASLAARCVKVKVVQDGKEQTRQAYPSIRVEGHKRRRVSYQKVARTPEFHDSLTRDALNGLEAWRRRYDQMDSLSKYEAPIQSVDDAIGQLRDIAADEAVPTGSPNKPK